MADGMMRVCIIVVAGIVEFSSKVGVSFVGFVLIRLCNGFSEVDQREDTRART
jgi:hypothetical protein